MVGAEDQNHFLEAATPLVLQIGNVCSEIGVGPIGLHERTIDVVAQPLGLDDLLFQTGTYTSYPMLRVTVPEDQANGTYRGTLVVTGIQP